MHSLTIFNAVSREILCPWLTIIGFVESSVLQRAAPHTLPEFPISSTCYEDWRLAASTISFTFFLDSPSTLKTFFPTPIVGMLNSTPIWEADPNSLVWKIPFPSTSKICGSSSGEFYQSLSKRILREGISLKAKNPGT